MELAHLNALWKCNKCGACTAVCPLYHETVNEGMAARGKLALLEAVVDGALVPSEALQRKIEDCLLCGACAQSCPSLVPTTDLFLEARGELARIFGVPLPVRLFLFALASPLLVGTGMAAVRVLQRARVPRLAEGWAGAWLPGAIRAALRSVSPIARRPYRARPLPCRSQGDGPRPTVAHFAGCFMNWGFADTAEATRLVLQFSGYRVESPPVVCCGMPHRVSGDPETARHLARQNVETLERYAVIVTDCASCGAALKEYRDLLADDPDYRERARVVSSRVADVSEFLMRHEPPRPRGELPVRVTYHEPCHLGRGQGVKAQPREMKGADVCCGGAGSFCITHPDLSGKVGATKVESILATRADVVASGCPSCMFQLRTALQERGAFTRVCHPVDLLAESYRKDEGSVDAPVPLSSPPSNQIPSH
jgi:glycolate oxidase iron-sulfur subunit